MVNDFKSIWEGFDQLVVMLIVTYWLHSTLLLAVVWFFCRLIGNSNEPRNERLWKFGAVAPLITAPCALWLGLAIPGNSFARLANMDRERGSVGDISAMYSATDFPQSEGWTTSITTTSPDVSRSPEVEITPIRTTLPEPVPDAIVEPASLAPLSKNVKYWHGWLRARTPSWSNAFCLAIGTTALVGACRVVLQILKLRYRLSQCQFASDDDRSTLDRLLNQNAIDRRVDLLTVNSTFASLACGWLRWRIIVSTRCFAQLTQQERFALLAHEVGHLVRGDTYWALIGSCLCSCLPFQPLNFLARRQWIMAAEFACDEWAVANKADPLCLASCLTSFAQWKLDAQQLRPELAVAGAGPVLASRIERLLICDAEPLARRRHRRWWIALAASMCFAGLSCFSPMSQAQLRPDPESISIKSPDRSASSPERESTTDPVETRDDSIALELADLDRILARCRELASRSDDVELQMLSELMRERARLLNRLLER